jgi:signal transduction histidine kinase
MLRAVTRLADQLLAPAVVLALEEPVPELLLAGDAGELEQALLSVLLNARDAIARTGRVGRVVVAAALTEADDLPPELALDQVYLRVDVVDDGPGVSPELLARLFDPFFSTKEPGLGTGMGLPTAYGALRACGGTLSCASEPGCGATFSLFVPRAPE